MFVRGTGSGHIVYPVTDVSTLAGSGTAGEADGIGAAATFDNPIGIATSPQGIAAVADSANHLIRKLDLSTGAVATLAGAADTPGTTDGIANGKFNEPTGVVFRPGGFSLLVGDKGNHAIREVVMATGEVTTLTGLPGTSGATDGTLANARFNQPGGVDISPDGTKVLVADTGNHVIRMIDLAGGQVTTFAGTMGTSGDTDGTATSATFASPQDVAYSPDGSYAFVTSGTKLRKLDMATAAVTTVSHILEPYGNGNTANTLGSPVGVDISPDGAWAFVVDSGQGADVAARRHVVRRINIATGWLSTWAGKGLTAGSGFVNGPGSARIWNQQGTATLNEPMGVSLTFDGSFALVTEKGNDAIRVVDLNECSSETDNCNGNAACANTIGSFTCTCNSGFKGDGVFSCVDQDECSMAQTFAVGTGLGTDDGAHYDFCATHADCAVGHYCDGGGCWHCNGLDATYCDAMGRVGSATPEACCDDAELLFHCPPSEWTGMAALCGNDPTTDPRQTCAPNCACDAHASCTNRIGSFECTCDVGYGGDGITCNSWSTFATDTLVSSGFRSIQDMEVSPVDPTTMFICDGHPQVSPSLKTINMLTGAVATVVDISPSDPNDGPRSVALSPDGSYAYVAEAMKIHRVDLSTNTKEVWVGSDVRNVLDGTGTAAQLAYATGLTMSPDGSTILFADGYSCIRKIVVATTAVSTIAGACGTEAYADGAGAAARFDDLSDIAYSPDGTYALVAGGEDNRIRKIFLMNHFRQANRADVTTVAGSGATGSADGVGTAATFDWPGSIDFSPDGSYALIIDGTAGLRRLDIATARVSTPVALTNLGVGVAFLTEKTFMAGAYTSVIRVDVDECGSNTHNCYTDATCTTANTAGCTDTVGGFVCSGYEGTADSCADVDECALGIDNCHADATCANTEGSFDCTCNAGYSDDSSGGDGTSCANIDECTAGTDDCDANAACTDTAGSFTCACNSGYEGTGTFCADVDECALGDDNCHADATCANTEGSFDCTCNAGYTGNASTLCVDIDECATGSGTGVCHENAICHNTEGSYSCVCTGLYAFTSEGEACSSTLRDAIIAVGLVLSVLSLAVVALVVSFCRRGNQTSKFDGDVKTPGAYTGA